MIIVSLLLVLLALLGAGLLWVFLFRTRAGWAQQIGGLAPQAARYAGFSSCRAIWLALLVSGGAAGLAAALEVAGPIGQLTPYVPAGYGFAAIIVAYVGRLHPVGMVFSAVLMSMFYIGGELAQSRMGLVKVQRIVFMVAGHKIHRHRPTVQWRKTRQTEIWILQFRAALVGTDIAGQNQNIRMRGRACLEVRL